MDNWAYIEPIGAALEIRFPKNYTSKVHTTRISDELVLLMAEYTVKVDEKGHDKTYMVKIEQKIGSAFTGNMIGFALQNDTNRYKKMAESLDGKLVTEQEFNLNQYRGKDFYITYTKDKKPLSIRVRILFTDVSRIYLITQGPQATAYSYRDTNFFDKIKPIDGNAKIPGSFDQEWINYTSPKNIFTMKAQTKESPYVQTEVTFNNQDKKETGKIVFSDPILKHTMTYTVTSDILDKPLSESEIKFYLVEQYLHKYIPNAPESYLRTENLKVDGRRVMTGRVAFTPQPNFPNVNFLLLEAHIKDNILVVQELAGPANFVGSPLGLNLFAHMKFHPEKMGQPVPPPSLSPKPVADIAPQAGDEIKTDPGVLEAKPAPEDSETQTTPAE